MNDAERIEQIRERLRLAHEAIGCRERSDIDFVLDVQWLFDRVIALRTHLVRVNAELQRFKQEQSRRWQHERDYIPYADEEDDRR